MTNQSSDTQQIYDQFYAEVSTAFTLAVCSVVKCYTQIMLGVAAYLNDCYE